MPGPNLTLRSGSLELEMRCEGCAVNARLYDIATGFYWADGPYIYEAVRASDEGFVAFNQLRNVAVEQTGTGLRVEGQIAGLRLEHVVTPNTGNGSLEERLILCNLGAEAISLDDFYCGFQRPITGRLGSLLPDVAHDRVVAVPLRHRASDADDWDNDFGMSHFIAGMGREPCADDEQEFGYMPSEKRLSEGWTWLHGDRSLGV